MWKMKLKVVAEDIRIITTAKEVSENNTKQALNTLWKKKAMLGTTHNKGRATICNLKPE